MSITEDALYAVPKEHRNGAYELLRVARKLERFGDLITNVGERIIYQETGTLEEINVDEAEAPLNSRHLALQTRCQSVRLVLEQVGLTSANSLGLF